jgi:hypothetical protein
MADDTLAERLTILERAHLLHDATLRRHGDMLDGHDERLHQHAEQMQALHALMARQVHTQQDLAATQARLAETLDAIKDMLDRGNGH